jgi:hypothetical protein
MRIRNELDSLYRLPKNRVNKSKRLRWQDMQPKWKKLGELFKISTGKPTGKRPLGRPMHRWEYSIPTYLKEVSVNTRNYNDSVQDRNY